MTEFTIAFRCSSCGEELDVEEQDGWFQCDEYHDCLGETAGLVAATYRDKIVCSGADDFEVVVRR